MGTRVRTYGLKGGGGLCKQGKEQLQQFRLVWEAPKPSSTGAGGQGGGWMSGTDMGNRLQ